MILMTQMVFALVILAGLPGGDMNGSSGKALFKTVTVGFLIERGELTGLVTFSKESVRFMIKRG